MALKISLPTCLAVFISSQAELSKWELKIGHIIGDHRKFLWIRPVAIWVLSVFENTAKLGEGPLFRLLATGTESDSISDWNPRWEEALCLESLLL